MRQILNLISKQNKRKRAARLESENESFLRAAGEQLRILAKKGLSIPVFTL